MGLVIFRSGIGRGSPEAFKSAAPGQGPQHQALYLHPAAIAVPMELERQLVMSSNGHVLRASLIQGSMAWASTQC